MQIPTMLQSLRPATRTLVQVAVMNIVKEPAFINRYIIGSPPAYFVIFYDMFAEHDAEEGQAIVKVADTEEDAPPLPRMEFAFGSPFWICDIGNGKAHHYGVLYRPFLSAHVSLHSGELPVRMEYVPSLSDDKIPDFALHEVVQRQMEILEKHAPPSLTALSPMPDIFFDPRPNGHVKTVTH